MHILVSYNYIKNIQYKLLINLISDKYKIYMKYFMIIYILFYLLLYK